MAFVIHVWAESWGPDLSGMQGEKEDALRRPHQAEEGQWTGRGQRFGSGHDRLAHGGGIRVGKGSLMVLPLMYAD